MFACVSVCVCGDGVGVGTKTVGWTVNDLSLLLPFVAHVQSLPRPSASHMIGSV